MKTMFTVRSVSLGATRKLCEKLVGLTVRYAAEAWNMRLDEAYKLDIIKTKC